MAHCGALVERAFAAGGMPRRSASERALRLMEEMRSHFGGSTLYFAKMSRPDAEEHAAEVLAAWSEGTSIPEIAQRRGWTERYVYKLLAKERARLAGIRQRTAKKAKA